VEEGQKPVKSFWKKYEFIIIAAATLLFVYLVVFSSQKANFFLGNGLIVYLTPSQKSFSMHYGDIGKAEFDVSIENFAYCKASCSYSFNDRSRNEVIDSGVFGIKIGQHAAKSYNLSVRRLGSGQDIYSFDIACRSISSPLCLTKGIEKSRSSLVTVNYDLTETEKELKGSLKQNVTKLLGFLAGVDAMQQKLSQRYFELGFKVNLKNLSREKGEIDDIYGKFAISAENLRSLWSTENYSRISRLFNQSFFEELENIEKSIKRLDGEIDNIAALHNGLLSRLAALEKNFRALESFAVMLENEEGLDAAVRSFNAVSSALTNNTFENYSSATNGIGMIESQHGLIISGTKPASAKLFFDAEHSLKFDSDFLCSLMQNCKENFSVSNAVKKTEKFLKNYPDDLMLKEACSSLNELNNLYIGARNKTLDFIANKSIAFPSDSEFIAFASGFRDNEARRINNSYFDSLEKLRQENMTDSDALKLAEESLPKNRTDFEQLQYNGSVNVTLHLLSKSSPSNKTMELLGKCAMYGKTAKLGSFIFDAVNPVINYTIIQRIDTTLSDNMTVCCVFNDCRPCCRSESCINDPKTFPVIFLHGHSLAKSNSPEFSLDAFNKLQSKLQDDGYLNAGIVSLYSKNEPSQMGIWGLSGKPITVKVSYYFDAFRKEDKYVVIPTKSENIDTYALRLKDLVEIVKERTGRPKVDIIAHSMGGLVARRYIQIFGENDIDKFIMIATPNKGVSGAVGDYCGLVGENRECVDMQESSLFMNKLNNPANQPGKIRMYTIIGRGCQMKFGNGDGITTVESASLQNSRAYYINGTCSGLFGEMLHTAILDIDQYPKTYETVREILKE